MLPLPQTTESQLESMGRVKTSFTSDMSLQQQKLSLFIWLNGKFLRFSNEKSIIFFQIHLQCLINYIISIAC
jgi:hypothetical protein